jgi:hypothetical protein
MPSLFTIKDTFQNKINSKELVVKSILTNRQNNFELHGSNYTTVLLGGRSNSIIQIATLIISDNKIELISSYDKAIKYLIILSFILASASIIVFLSSYIFQFSINKDLNMMLIIYPALIIIMFIVSRIALFTKRNELIESLKKSNII